MAKKGVDHEDDDDHHMDDDDNNVEPKSSSSATKTKSSKKDRKSVESAAATAAGNVAETTKKSATIHSKTYEERCQAVNVMSHPLASKKSTKKCYKLVKKASSQKHIRRGVKEVVKGLRKGDRGLAVLAGDIYPLDVMSHLPILLEDYNVPYLFVPSKQELGAAACTKRPTSCVLIKTPASLIKKTKNSGESLFDGQDLYDTLLQEAKEYNPTNI
jgi:H/ACA ribonucleoprotein complex subunit 2